MKVGDIKIDVKKSKRKTMSIFVERDGTVSALVPENLSDIEIQHVLEAKEYQINKYLAEWKVLNYNKIEREYVNGQSYLYLGRNYRLRLVDDEHQGIVFKDGYFELSKNKLEKAKELFKDFYKKKLEVKIERIVKTHLKRMGLSANRIKVMELQNRWGSCSVKGNLNFHWKCAMAPVDVINYIVAHEVVHLKHPNHSREFWNDLDKLIPNYQRHIDWLREHGAGMDL
jgi:predicted metal-dependent hydrolase